MTVTDIIVPCDEIVCINVTDEWRSIIRQLTHSPHGRIVLYRDNLDDAINMLRGAAEMYYVPEETPLNVQLVKVQRNKEKVGIIVNEYGDIQKLVTLEDVFEEIVGDFTTPCSKAWRKKSFRKGTVR